MGSWKFSHGKLVHGEKAQLGNPAACLNFPSCSPLCLQAPPPPVDDFVWESLFALPIRLPQSSLLNAVDSDLMMFCCLSVASIYLLLAICLFLIVTCLLDLLIQNPGYHRSFFRSCQMDIDWSNFYKLGQSVSEMLRGLSKVLVRLDQNPV